MSVSINGTNGLTFGDGSAQNTGGYTGFRNRIINGAMMIDQRNAGAAVTPSGYSYQLDRFFSNFSQASKFTIQQNAGSVTPPAGFSNYLGATVAATATVGTSDYFFIAQNIEGNNVADLGWGAAGASTVTLSFWVRSSVTGTFGGAIKGSNVLTYPFTYTINSANTWEQKTVTVTGATTDTWPTNNTASIMVAFSLAMGSTRQGTAGAWVSAGGVYSATGTTNLVTTLGATFYLTGVQLEKGSVATPFENRPYGMELGLCQRYCVVYSTEQTGYRLGLGYTYSTTAGVSGFNLPVTMRTPPSISGTPSNVTFNDSVGGYNAGTPTINSSQENFVTLTATASGMTAGRGNQMYFTNPSSKLILSAEM